MRERIHSNSDHNVNDPIFEIPLIRAFISLKDKYWWYLGVKSRVVDKCHPIEIIQGLEVPIETIISGWFSGGIKGSARSGSGYSSHNRRHSGGV